MSSTIPNPDLDSDPDSGESPGTHAEFDAVPRVRPAALLRAQKNGDPTLLICAYEGDASFAKFPLRGALAWSAFQARRGQLPLDAELVLYCRCPNDLTALRAAANLRAAGWSGTRVLSGGQRAALAAGMTTR